MGGVILRRERVKLVLFGQKAVGKVQTATGTVYEVGTLSAVLDRRLLGYEALPPWTDDPTDAHLRAEVSPLISISDASTALPRQCVLLWASWHLSPSPAPDPALFPLRAVRSCFCTACISTPSRGN